MSFGDILFHVVSVILFCIVGFISLFVIAAFICVLYRIFCRLLGCFIKNFWGDKQPEMWENILDPLFPIMFAFIIYIAGGFLLKWDFLSVKYVSELLSEFI